MPEERVKQLGLAYAFWSPCSRRPMARPSLIVQVTEALGLDWFAVAGSSGAGPYLAACAYALPDRVRAVGMLGVIAPLDAPGVRDGMTLRRRILYRMLGLSRYAVPLFRIMGPAGIDGAMNADVPESDRRVLQRIHEPYMVSKREALRAGLGGFAHELALASRPWGFPLEDIRVPVLVWHGERDVSTPIAMARALAAAIPTARARYFPDLGHFLAYELWPEIVSVWGGKKKRGPSFDE